MDPKTSQIAVYSFFLQVAGIDASSIPSEMHAGIYPIGQLLSLLGPCVHCSENLKKGKWLVFNG